MQQSGRVRAADVLVSKTGTLTLEDLKEGDQEKRNESTTERTGLCNATAPQQLVSTALVQQTCDRHSDESERRIHDYRRDDLQK